MAAPFQRWLARAAEKLARRYYEGPDPPVRIAEVAEEFARAHPRATRGQWLEMAKELAREAYRSGYVRAFEKYDRDPENEREQFDPDDLAEAERHEWTWAGPTAHELGLEEEAAEAGGDAGQSLGLEAQGDYLALRELYERENMGRGPGRRR